MAEAQAAAPAAVAAPAPTKKGERKRGGDGDKIKKGLVDRLPAFTLYTAISLAFVYYYW